MFLGKGAICALIPDLILGHVQNTHYTSSIRICFKSTLGSVYSVFVYVFEYVFEYVFDCICILFMHLYALSVSVIYICCGTYLASRIVLAFTAAFGKAPEQFARLSSVGLNLGFRWTGRLKIANQRWMDARKHDMINLSCSMVICCVAHFNPLYASYNGPLWQ